MLGAGKSGFATARAVEMARKRTRRGRRVILASNILLTPPDGLPFVQVPTGEAGLDVDSLTAVQARAAAEGADVIVVIDEAGIAMGARFWQSSPAFLTHWLAMSRKRRVDVIWTAHDAEDVETVLRRRTSFTYDIKRVPSGGDDGTNGPPWFLIVTRYARTDVGNRKRRLGLPALRRWKRSWQDWFDSDEIVPLPGRVTSRERRRSAGGRAARSEEWAGGGPDPSPVGP